MTLPAPPSSHPPVIVMSHPEGAYTTCRTSSEGGKCWIAESTQALCIDCGVCLVASQPTRGRSPSRLQYDIEPCQLPCPRSLGRPSQRTAGALLESAQAEHQVRACVPRLSPQGLVLSLSFARHIVVIKLWAIEDRPPNNSRWIRTDARLDLGHITHTLTLSVRISRGDGEAQLQVLLPYLTYCVHSRETARQAQISDNFCTLLLANIRDLISVALSCEFHRPSLRSSSILCPQASVALCVS